MAWVPRFTRVELPRPLEGRASRTLETTSTPWLAGRDLADQTLSWSITAGSQTRMASRCSVLRDRETRPSGVVVPIPGLIRRLARQVNLENCTVA